MSQLRWRLATVFVALTLGSVVFGSFEPIATVFGGLVLLAMYAVVVRWMDDWQPATRSGQ